VRQNPPKCYIMTKMKDIDFNKNKDGLVPAIAQDADTGEVLMLAYMNAEALRRTLKSGEAWFYSRSRQELWHKGETSGNTIKVSEVWKDCDSDTILIKGKPTGPVCHTGNPTCFFQKMSEKDLD
jgi:phosphoribosyl-AMP cyclohydrolase